MNINGSSAMIDGLIESFLTAAFGLELKEHLTKLASYRRSSGDTFPNPGPNCAPPPPGTPTAGSSRYTRRLMRSARFASKARDGYQAAAIEGISRAARVTRGAFYHHFEDKKTLFDALVNEMQAEAAAKIEARAKTHKAIWDRLSAGIDAFLDTCLEPDYARIVVHEAPAVLGAKRFREIEEAYPMALLAATLEALKRRGELKFEDIDLLCRMVDAMICKIAIMLPDSKNPSVLRARGQDLIARLLESYRRVK